MPCQVWKKCLLILIDWAPPANRTLPGIAIGRHNTMAHLRCPGAIKMKTHVTMPYMLGGRYHFLVATFSSGLKPTLKMIGKDIQAVMLP